MNTFPGISCTLYAEPNCVSGPRPPSWAMLTHDDPNGKDYLTEYWDGKGFLVDVAHDAGGPGSFVCQAAK